MNKTLAITTIVLVAVVMGMSTIAPMIPQAYASHRHTIIFMREKGAFPFYRLSINSFTLYLKRKLD